MIYNTAYPYPESTTNLLPTSETLMAGRRPPLPIITAVKGLPKYMCAGRQIGVDITLENRGGKDPYGSTFARIRVEDTRGNSLVWMKSGSFFLKRGKSKNVRLFFAMPNKDIKMFAEVGTGKKVTSKKQGAVSLADPVATSLTLSLKHKIAVPKTSVVIGSGKLTRTDDGKPPGKQTIWFGHTSWWKNKNTKKNIVECTTKSDGTYIYEFDLANMPDKINYTAQFDGTVQGENCLEPSLAQTSIIAPGRKRAPSKKNDMKTYAVGAVLLLAIIVVARRLVRFKR